MPSIEMVSIGCPRVPQLPDYPSFGVRVDAALRTHRWLFQPVFDRLSGVMVHLGDKDMAVDGPSWFAGTLMNWRDPASCGAFPALLFLPEVRGDVSDLMRRMLALSPERRMTFSTDVQQDHPATDGGELTLEEFWALHDARKLRYNMLCWLRDSATDHAKSAD